MSRTRFRSFVALQLIILISFWVGAMVMMHGTSTPSEVVAPLQETSARIPLILTIILLAATIFQIMGLIGIIFLKGWARHVFLLGTTLSLVTILDSAGGSDPYPSAILPLLSGVYWINSGAVLALSYTRLIWNSLQQPTAV